MQQFKEDGIQENPSLPELNGLFLEMFHQVCEKTNQHNPWFIPEFVRKAVHSIGLSLEEENLRTWTGRYDLEKAVRGKPLKIGLILAGNLPLVGMHDLLCVLFSGHCAELKLSSKDDQLLPAIITILKHINPELASAICINEEFIRQPDAVIATGSDNSARYFEYYFGKYPHIIRKNRNSVAVLDGTESSTELERLAEDIFTYFGLGCRNVSKIYVPSGYDLPYLLDHFASWSWLANHNRYANNYEYHRAIHLVNRQIFLDTGFLILKEDSSFASPVGSLYYESYTEPEELVLKLNSLSSEIQCLVSKNKSFPQAIPFGATQTPMLWDYADGIDTMRFLLNLSEK